MSDLIHRNPNDLYINPFNEIGEDWMLITAEKDGKCNSMTANWGGLGYMWNENVAFIFVRKSRYTKEFIDAADQFSLSFLDHKDYVDTLLYMGSASGKDEDKIAKSNLHIEREDGVPYIQEADRIFICTKMSCSPINPDGFAMEELNEEYPLEDYHVLYIARIDSVLEKTGD